MSNAKYTPAPQQDPDDYAQAPPSYQAEGSAAAGSPFGGARSSEDNIPDDFKVDPLSPSSLHARVMLLKADIAKPFPSTNTHL